MKYLETFNNLINAKKKLSIKDLTNIVDFFKNL